MTAIIITAHAAARYVEYVAPRMTTAQARAAIADHERAIVTAARFGCRCVRLGCGAKLVLDHLTVVTVIQRHELGCSTFMPMGSRL